MSLKKIIIGEPMPDKNDPKYKERYEVLIVPLWN